MNVFYKSTNVIDIVVFSQNPAGGEGTGTKGGGYGFAPCVAIDLDRSRLASSVLPKCS